MKSNKNEEEENSMLYISFNQDNSFFSIGTEKGFVIYKASPLNDFYKRELKGGIGHISMFDNTNIIGLVGGGKRPFSALNKLVFSFLKKNEEQLKKH